MTLRVLKPGLLTTIQGGPRRGFRHLGIPAAGPADPLSLALANRLLGNPLTAAGLEVTLSGVALRAEAPTAVAVAGADVDVSVNDDSVSMHRSIELRAGDELELGGARAGVRSYLAVLGGILGARVLGSTSTYLPAAIGGLDGRALAAGDVIEAADEARFIGDLSTPDAYRPQSFASVALRACPIDAGASNRLFDTTWRVGQRADRMGIELLGATITNADSGRLPSAPVFPGLIQVPPDGTPFLLSVDAQTTGGYARLAQVIRADRHLIGQLRPGESLGFIERTPSVAVDDLHEKLAYWDAWLPGCAAVFT